MHHFFRLKLCNDFKNHHSLMYKTWRYIMLNKNHIKYAEEKENCMICVFLFIETWITMCVYAYESTCFKVNTILTCAIISFFITSQLLMVKRLVDHFFFYFYYSSVFFSFFYMLFFWWCSLFTFYSVLCRTSVLFFFTHLQRLRRNIFRW